MDPVVEKLTTARVGLLLRHPFFGNMATRLQLERADWCKTIATDGRKFYYNYDFVASLSPRKVEFGFAHEVLHCVFDHFGRTTTHNKKLANIAQDYAVNQILVDDHIGEKITEIKIFQDNKFRDMPWEQIYEILQKEAKQRGNNGGGGLDGEMLDDHLEVEGSISDDDSDDDRPTISSEDLQKIRNEIKEAMISAAAAAAGKVPSGVARLIKTLTEPKMDWRDVLQMNIQSIVRNDYSFSRPSRKGWHTGAILPGMIPGQEIDVAVALDMSGSIGNSDAMAFLSEVKGIMDQYDTYTIRLWCFDTKTYNLQVFTQDNAEELLTYQLKGGGGTDFGVNWDFMKEMNLVPKRFIMFTDGYPCGSWGDPDYCPTLFLIKGNKQAHPPFGESVIYESL